MRDPVNPADPDRTWFRSHIEPVLDATPADDGWPRIAARIDGQPIPEHRAPTRHRARRAAVAAAAAVLLAGLAMVVTAGRGDHDASRLTTAPPAPTGWYV
ncbi:MAG TPA: hypothetical protein VNQ33_02340, partial [Acidimicrobiales bacterium]|nr:hypothetical protein [Acidimicrobiales bacterium]